MKNQEFDEYRVTLFKKKIKAVVPGGENIRFERSVGRSALIIDFWRFGARGEVRKNNIRVVEDAFRKAGIEYQILGFWRDSEQDYFTIPIDQAALPERARTYKNTYIRGQKRSEKIRIKGKKK